MASDSQSTLNVSTLEAWLWEAADQIRDSAVAPRVRNIILPLLMLKRLSDVFEDEVNRLAEEVGDDHIALQLAEAGHATVRFFVPPIARWPAIRYQTSGLGEYLNNAVSAVASKNPELEGVIDGQDFNATTAGQPIVSEANLIALVQILSRYRLGLRDVAPANLGRAFEYLLRTFAEGQGQSAAEFYTPGGVAGLIARILDPKPGMEVYDPTCGTAGILAQCHLRLMETYGELTTSLSNQSSRVTPLKLYGQERNTSMFALAQMNTLLYEMDAEIAHGDTMEHPAFVSQGQLKQFDLVAAHPPWNLRLPVQFYEHDPYDRFGRGIPPSSSADWGWVQHMVSSVNEEGRMAIVLDEGAVSRGSSYAGIHRERDIRRVFVEGDLVNPGDLIEAVILLPAKLFYYTISPGILMILNKAKAHPGEILLINASGMSSRHGRRSHLTEESIEQIATIYHDWREEEGLSAIVSQEEVARNNYNLSPDRYIFRLKTAILLGAGASRDADIPLTTEMTQKIYERTSGEQFADREGTRLGTALSTVIGGLIYQKGIRGESPYWGLNVEEVFASVQMLANRSDIEAAPFIGSWHSAIDELEEEPAADYEFDNLYQATRDNIAEELRKAAIRSTSPLRQIEKEYETQVKKKNPKLEWGKWIGSALAAMFKELEKTAPPHTSKRAFRKKMGGIVRRDSSPREGNIFERLSEHMILSLRDLVWLPEGHDVSYLMPLLDLETEQQLKIYSLNYDNAVERLCQQNEISYTVGVDMSGAVRFDPVARIHLTKLHGSIDWVEIEAKRPLPLKGFRLASSKEMDRRDQMSRPAIIFGQGNKLTSEGPYLELLRDFSTGLEEHHNLLVIGYSFRDAHVNQYIAQWFNNDPDRQMVILSGPRFLEESQGNSFVQNLLNFGATRVKVVEETTARGLEEAINEVKDIARRLSWERRKRGTER